MPLSALRAPASTDQPALPTGSMIDRGAELEWVSQYPHEREILYPDLEPRTPD